MSTPRLQLLQSRYNLYRSWTQLLMNVVLCVIVRVRIINTYIILTGVHLQWASHAPDAAHVTVSVCSYIVRSDFIVMYMCIPVVYLCLTKYQKECRLVYMYIWSIGHWSATQCTITCVSVQIGGIALGVRLYEWSSIHKACALLEGLGHAPPEICSWLSNTFVRLKPETTK